MCSSDIFLGESDAILFMYFWVFQYNNFELTFIFFKR